MEIVPILELIRLEEAYAGTFGVLRIQKQIALFTLEPEDRENEIGKSSIPAQQYWCNRIESEKFGETFIVNNVPGRTGILFHAGNWEEHTEGCILLGTSIIEDKRGVSNSKNAMIKFLTYLKGFDKAHLTIMEVY